MLNRRTAVLLGKALVSIGLLFILLRAISWSSLKKATLGADLGWVALAILVGFLQFAVSTWRWQLLLRSLDTQPPSLAVLMRYYLIGGLFNNFAPANLAGDAARIIALAQENENRVVAAGSVVMERVLNLAGLAMIATWSSLSRILPISLGAERAMVWLGAACALGVAAALLYQRFRPSKRLQDWSARMAGLACAMARHPAELGQVVAATMMLHFVTMLITVCNAQAVSVRLPLTIHLAVYAVAAIAIALPISIQGIGVREAVYTALFGIVGVPQEQVIAIMVLNYLVLAFYSLVGGVLVWTGSRKPRAQVG